MDIVKEKSSGRVSEVKIGKGEKEVAVGGHGTLPFLDFEGDTGHRPILALEVRDWLNPDWNPYLSEYWKDASSTAEWVKKAESFSPDLLCVRFMSADPDTKNTSAEDTVKTLEEVLKNTRLPLIITGCGNIAKDQEIIPALTEAAKGENALFGIAVKENYKTLAAAALAGGHSLIAETPLDINLAKQLNILISDMGLGTDKIVMHHSTGGLGYGLEYCYSIMERCRLAALSGDAMMSPPVLNFIGQECWKTKEAKDSSGLGLAWEVTTGVAYLEAGSDILVLNHPESLEKLRKAVNQLSAGGDV
ncbi:MAG: acetyl-CoA decarbonylase/synthase complex subunit delta [Candidatus Omnitrophota bacterium]|nr:acetyl-CoA decarbonylase/synthase complex subunit delta [bacterium]MBU3930785.1 acetyl-CoA decarbonylase/synthase complex subunit delta [bacterium]MBU4123463.1 acetyl-CoA decarbonylase/synthase complex subunit delta [bacterium]